MLISGGDGEVCLDEAQMIAGRIVHAADNRASDTNSDIFIHTKLDSFPSQALRSSIEPVAPKLSQLPSLLRISFSTPAMTSSLPGNRDLPVSQYDLSTYWGRVRHAADISDPR